jgi:GT2 family glycosyltransferase
MDRYSNNYNWSNCNFTWITLCHSFQNLKMTGGSRQVDNFFYPAVSIITVNYNGIRYLADLFNSISKLDYPKDRIQVIMVDNCSGDSSVDFVKNNYPFVEIISMSQNTGFAGGNNAGFKAATGDYIALINNDCTVGSGWLKTLARFAVEKSCVEKFGAAGSKVLFFYSYLIAEFSMPDNVSVLISEIIIDPDISSDGADGGSLQTRSFFLSDYDLLIGDMGKSIKFLKNCRLVRAGINGKPGTYRVTNGAIIGFPVVYSSNGTNIKLTACPENVQVVTGGNAEIKIDIIKYENNSKNQNPAGTMQPDKSLGEPAVIDRKQVYCGLLQGETGIINIEILKNDYDFRQRIINSCGLEINRSFYARDRGANTVDIGWFNHTEEIFSPSGSSLFISKKCLEDTGFFESGFFTYYEDLDLFWRARLRGWRMYFVPGSIASHHHCGTGTEWSKTFTYHVLRNRLLAIYRCGWPKLVLRSQAAFTAALILGIAGLVKSVLKGKKQHRPDIIIRLRILFELFYLLPLHFFKRVKIRKTSIANEHYIRKWIVDF